MTAFTMRDKVKKIITAIAIAAFWLAVWELIYLSVKQEILIVSPARVFARLSELIATKNFWLSAAATLLRIMTGYLAAVISGVLTAFLTFFVPVFNRLLSPLMSVIKAAPVASFIILALVWLGKNTVPVFISSIIVLPVIWANVSEGLRNTDRKLIDMSAVFGVSKAKKLYSIYIPSAFSYFLAGCTSALGLAWKAGVAAEVLSTPKMSIGTQLSDAKIYLETADLFSWTLVIIVFSLILERLIKALLGTVMKKGVKREGEK